MRDFKEAYKQAEEAAEEIKTTLRKMRLTREVAGLACNLAGRDIRRETREAHVEIEQQEYK